MMRRRAAPLHDPSGRVLCQLPALDWRPGECWALMGPNGIGKSSCLREVSGRESAAHDTPWVWRDAPLPVWHDPDWARQRASLGQQHVLSAPLRVRTVIEMGAYPWGGAAAIPAALMATLIGDWDLAALLDRRWPELSGGEQQRVQLARSALQLALADPAQPRLWLLDEPLTALDWPHQQQVISACHAAAAAGATVAVSVHDLNAAHALASHALVLGRDGVLFAGEMDNEKWRCALEQALQVRLGWVDHPEDGRPWLLPLR